MIWLGERLKVCPPQGRQLLDIHEEDLFEDFRICDTYRGGGGYDQFPHIARKRGLVHELIKGDISKQFVVQLYGCHLRCPYCYVTRDGIFGEAKDYYPGQLLESFWRAQEKFNVGVFHMMGGAPAHYMEKWPIIIQNLYPFYLFHSDLLLTEKPYDTAALYNIGTRNALYAINIKGVTEEDYFQNTGTEIDWCLFWDNFYKVVDSRINFYLTFTNPDLSYLEDFKDEIRKRYGRQVLEDNFIINIKQYDALEAGPAW